MSDPDYSTWLTKQQAADWIGVTTKTIERLAQDGKIQQAAWRPENRGPERAVYHPEDVAHIASERRPGLSPFVVPRVGDRSANGNGHAVGIAVVRNPESRDSSALALPVGDDPIRLLFGAALRAVSEKSETPPLFLTIPEAAVVSGFSQAYLRRKCQAGWSGAIKDRAWKIRRKDLEQL
jgi:hypothetical protein